MITSIVTFFKKIKGKSGWVVGWIRGWYWRFTFLQVLSKDFDNLQGCKNSGFAEKLKRDFKEVEEVAECSVCQFVKSNCLIGFDQGDGWFGAARRNSDFFSQKRQIAEGSLIYWGITQILRSDIEVITERSMKLLEFGDQAHRLGGVPVAAAAPVQELDYRRFFYSLTFHCNCVIFWAE